MTETVAGTVVENPATQPVKFQNYWGTKDTRKWYLPDGQQWIEFKIMNEGDKRKYQQRTNRDIKVLRDGETRVGIDPAEDRHTLIEMSVINWYMVIPQGDPNDPNTEWHEAAYAPPLLRKWLEQGDPKAIQDLEAEIRMANPWMQAEMSVEEIDKEIARLEEVRKQAIEREAEKAASGSR